MEIHQHIKTSKGDIWIADSRQNGFVKLDDESRQEFEARFLRRLLHEFIGNVELYHESNGAPFIKQRSDLHLSISHSDNWFALYVSDEHPVGIDIEIHSSHIEKTRKYFLTESEIEHHQPSVQQLKICWGVKESVFKLFRGNMKSMVEEIQIASLDEHESKVKFQDQTICLKHQQSEAFTLVYTD